MKLIDFSNIGLGMELSPSFSKHTQEAIVESLGSMLKGLTNNAAGVIILSGCVMTKVGNQYDQTPGYVFYNGEILEVDVFAGNDAVLIPVYNPPSNTFTSQAWYGDGVKRDTFYIRKMPMSMAAAGSSVADYTAAKRIEDFKANKIQSAWVNIALNAWWTTVLTHTPQYRIDEFGMVHLKGTLKTITNSENYKIANAGAVPSVAVNKQINFPKVYTGSAGGGYVAYLHVTIEDDGSVYANKAPQWANVNTIDVQLNLDGINYWPG